jgi:hypothetical protein
MRWKPGTSDAQKQAVREGLAALPAAIPEIRSYQFGDDAAIVEGNYEFAIVADFDSRSDFQTYAAHDVHPPDSSGPRGRSVRAIRAHRFRSRASSYGTASEASGP